MGDGSNFPPPSGVADEIIAKAIECLDRDIWHELNDDSITIRSVQFWIKDVTIRLGSDVSVLSWGKPTAAYQQAFRESYDKAMARQREKLMQPKLKSISDESFGRVPAWLRTLRAGGAVAGVAVGGFLIFAAVGSISSCAEQASIAAAADKARDGEVNRYGFKRGGIQNRAVWPDDCASSGYLSGVEQKHRSFSSIYECKRFWEGWERDGEKWVDWKAEP